MFSVVVSSKCQLLNVWFALIHLAEMYMLHGGKYSIHGNVSFMEKIRFRGQICVFLLFIHAFFCARQYSDETKYSS